MTRFIEIDTKLVMELVSALPHDELPAAIEVFRKLLEAMDRANTLLTHAAALKSSQPTKLIH
jgi:hypothetical protein